MAIPVRYQPNVLIINNILFPIYIFVVELKLVRMKILSKLVILVPAILSCNIGISQITTIWLTHKTNEPSHIVVNWESKEPGNSEVYFGTSSDYGSGIKKNENVSIHHVEIPMKKKDVIYHYMVKTNNEKSSDNTFKAYPSKSNELRIAVVGNWGYPANIDFSELMKDNPHILMTCGDNVSNLHTLCGQGVNDCIKPYLELIASQKQLFSSTPFMPVLGNHDKEIRNRGTKIPEIASYDTNATAYRKFFELPGDEWKWIFRIPGFDVTFIALDIQHISDFGTTWQTCHDFHRGSDQFEWYKKIMDKNPKGFIITLQNEKNGSIRAQEKGEWDKLFQKGTAVITGFGHFSERAEVKGFPYFNTSLVSGDKYPDGFSKILQGIKGYILLTFKKESPMKVEIKSLDGKVIDSSLWKKSNSF